MQKKAHKEKPQEITLEDQESHLHRIAVRQVYRKPRMVSYGPLAKNIAFGVGAGAEVDSTFSI